MRAARVPRGPRPSTSNEPSSHSRTDTYLALHLIGFYGSPPVSQCHSTSTSA
jgi:hypothetical protein